MDAASTRHILIWEMCFLILNNGGNIINFCFWRDHKIAKCIGGSAKSFPSLSELIKSKYNLTCCIQIELMLESQATLSHQQFTESCSSTFWEERLFNIFLLGQSIVVIQEAWHLRQAGNPENSLLLEKKGFIEFQNHLLQRKISSTHSLRNLRGFVEE